MPEHPINSTPSQSYGPAPFRVLIVDDEETYAASLKRLLIRRGLDTQVASTFAAAEKAAAGLPFDLVVLDYMLPDGSGLDLIPVFRALADKPAVLMMTAYGTIENAVEAMRRGAYDYMTKSTELKAIVDKVVDIERVRRARSKLRANVLDDDFSGLLGDSPMMLECKQRLRDVAKSPDTTVLLVGESGTGKGVAARAIHLLSARAKAPFVVIDCAALPVQSAEGELFGFENNGAPVPGRLELAGAGTLLLDEVGDMDPLVQTKLLRVLEERTFERVGGVKPVTLHARIIAASHRDLAQLVESGRFRLDLYHRLTVFPIALPPLSSRGQDVLALANYFVAEFSRKLEKSLAPISGETEALLLAYPFPGNVRELKNVIERAVILATGNAIAPTLLPDRVVTGDAVTAPVTSGEKNAAELAFKPGADTLDEFERRLVLDALRRAGGKKTKAAEILGISRFALMRRLEKFGIS